MTLFAAILRGLGLSHAEAADFLGVRPDTVSSWSAGRNPVPPGALGELHDLADREDEAADEAWQLWRRQGEPAEIELGLARDDAEARALGWPSVGAQMAVFARIWERLPPEVEVTIVPRGSTAATAAAMKARRPAG